MIGIITNNSKNNSRRSRIDLEMKNPFWLFGTGMQSHCSARETLENIGESCWIFMTEIHIKTIQTYLLLFIKLIIEFVIVSISPLLPRCLWPSSGGFIRAANPGLSNYTDNNAQDPFSTLLFPRYALVYSGALRAWIWRWLSCTSLYVLRLS